MIPAWQPVLRLSLAVILWAVWNWRFRVMTRRTLREFVALFPGRCPICSLHYYGVTHGYEDPGSKPEAHVCIERKP